MIIFSTKAHGVLDYLMGIALLAVPSILQLDSNSAEGMILYTLGAILLVYSVFTNYELGIIKVIPMKVHLTLDIFSGIFLASAPWVLRFEDQVCIPFIILGVAEIVAGITTTSKVSKSTPINNPPVTPLDILTVDVKIPKEPTKKTTVKSKPSKETAKEPVKKSAPKPKTPPTNTTKKNPKK